MTLEAYGLRQDPFPIVPDGPVYNWAGRQELREDLVDLVKGVRARDIGVTEFAILHGEYGAGKSHALRYLKTLIDEGGEFDSLTIYLERPRVAAKLNFLELHKYVVRSIGREGIIKYCRKIREITDAKIDDLARSAGLSEISNRASFEEQAVNQFPIHDISMIRLLRKGSEEGSRVFEFLAGLEAWKGDEYDGKIDSDFLAAKVLSVFFCVITAEIRPGLRICESVYLFLDECEVLIDAKATESELVFSGLRELINGLPYRFGLLLSFSAAGALIEAIMSQHLLKRMTVPYIEVPMLGDADAKEFLRIQLEYYRLEGSEYSESFSPFEEEAIDYIIQSTTELTPRNLFIQCKRVLERAIRRFGLESGSTISKEIADSILVGYR